jgi:hypothetical protein
MSAIQWCGVGLIGWALVMLLVSFAIRDWPWRWVDLDSDRKARAIHRSF